MDIRFDTMLYCNLGNGNSDPGHIKCSRGPQVPDPCHITCNLPITRSNEQYDVPRKKTQN